MDIANILSSKDHKLVTVGAGETISTVAGTLASEGLGAVVVADDAGGLAGIISERDIVRSFDQHGAALGDMTVDALMTRNVVTCAPDNSVEDVMKLMTEHLIRHLPVVGDGGLLGVVSILDIVQSRLSEVETDYGVLREFMSTRIE